MYGSLSREEAREMLRQKVAEEGFRRLTVSFYRYLNIEDPQAFRQHLLDIWEPLQCFGRIYVANEGINAQMSLPEHHKQAFLDGIEKTPGLENMTYRFAVEEDSISFYKLQVKVRKNIVADGLDDWTFNPAETGNHLAPEEFHELVGQEDTIVVDMRNHYESEVGHFEGAICPDVDTFREEITLVENELADQKDKKLLLYCTGGIRCEKASAYFKAKGFTDVNQLQGGIINYAHHIKDLGLESKFHGRNFVFDERLGERIDDQIISVCHQCGTACDTHTNCVNESCHLLFIQCPECKEKHENCCSDECRDYLHLPEDEKAEIRRQVAREKKAIFRSRLRPNLKKFREECLSE